jgi:hypothetical protein
MEARNGADESQGYFKVTSRLLQGYFKVQKLSGGYAFS